MSRQRQHRARELHSATGPRVEGDAADEAKPRDPVRMPDRDRLRDSTADVVTDDAGEVDSQMVQDRDEAFGVTAKVDGAGGRGVASAEAEKVEDHHAMSGGKQRNDVAPEMTRGGKPVHEHDRLAGATGSGRVVVETDAVEVQEFAAHTVILGNREGGTGKERSGREEGKR